jgi:GNAT superfamily N-acetyltransferase
MNLLFLRELSEEQTLQLHELYQGEWWSRGRSLEEVRTMLAHSGPIFGVRTEESAELIAFARVLSDRIFKAFLFDVIVHPAHRGQGLGRGLLRQILDAPELRQVRHFELYCLPERVSYYEEFGFSAEFEPAIRLMRKKKG